VAAPDPVIVDFKERGIDKRTARVLAGRAAIGGTPVADWWKRQSAGTQNRFMDSVRTSMRNGETSAQAATRVFGGTINGVKVPGVMQGTRAQAAALVQTSMNHVTNQARIAAFQENTDVIKAIQQVSTLDNRTTDICIAYSGDMWDVKTLEPLGKSHAFNGGPPRHFNCRSTLVPVTKSFEELGIDAKEVAGARASMDGQVAADITFDKWLGRKSTQFQDDLLGAARAELFRKGKISLSQLVDFTGNPLTITQLERLAALPVAARPPRQTARDVSQQKRDLAGKFTASDVFSEDLSSAVDQEIDGILQRRASTSDPRDVPFSVMTDAQRALLRQGLKAVIAAPEIYSRKARTEAARHLRQLFN
jgi:SPP1 gp7 family putative phage head morphogenesis protein